MESAPLNLAHFHERRADRHLKRNRYDEAIKAMETALAYIDDAYKTVSIPKGIQVLDAEKWNCSRKLTQINIRQSQHEGLKIAASTTQSVEQQFLENHQEYLTESTTSSIHQAIEDFDAKYTSSTIENQNQIEMPVTCENNNTFEEESMNWMEELQSKDFPTLAPLELPAFDIGFDNNPTFEDHN